MAEGKKKEYKLNTAIEAVKSLILRVEEINNGIADYPYETKICDVILFGSLVNSKKDTVHDVDVYLGYMPNFAETMLSFHQKHPRIFPTFIQDLYSEKFLQERYLKQKKGIFSFHDDLDKEYVIKDTHIYLFKDGVYCEGSLEQVLYLCSKEVRNSK